MIERSFSLSDQKAFAELSGDCNPMHVDPVAARRLLFGRPVVHGVHALLWALDRWLGSRIGRLALSRVDATFQTPIGVDEPVAYAIKGEDDRCAEIELSTEAGVAVRLRVETEPGATAGSDRLPDAPTHQPVCERHSAEDIASRLGALPLYLERDLANRLFPALSRTLPPVQLAELLATTRLVGMECPGLHSVYSGLQGRFSAPANGAGVAPELAYRVTKCDPRFSVVEMDVDGPSFGGTIKAFLRPGPQEQARLDDVKRLITPDEFAGQCALVVGGSRGLGEVVAKLLGVGGADVYLTYHRGAEDAGRVVSEMREGGAQAQCISYDVLEPSAEVLADLGGDGGATHLYYFATPFISGTRGSFSPDLFQRFCRYYVTGFRETVRVLREKGNVLQKVLYPSSVFVEELPKNFGEYAAAKMAGETLCAYLEKITPGLTIYRPRLPRLATDQTASLLPTKREDSVAVLLEHLRYLETVS